MTASASYVGPLVVGARFHWSGRGDVEQVVEVVNIFMDGSAEHVVVYADVSDGVRQEREYHAPARYFRKLARAVE